MKKKIKIKRFLVYIIIIIVAIVFGYYSYNYYILEKTRIPESFIKVNGRIEGDIITVATRIPGRVEKIYFKEGDSVKTGQLLIRLSSNELNAQKRAASALIEQYSYKLKSSRAQSKKATEDRIKREKDLNRMQNLFNKKVISETRLENYQLAYNIAIFDEKSALDNVSAVQKALQRAKAQLEEIEARLSDTRIVAPINGTIVTKITNIGEVLSPGGLIALIVDLNSLYLKAFVPEPQIGKVKLNLPAQIFVDAYPNKPFPATIRYISSRAEFTPKEVQTREERVKLVYAIKIYLNKNPGHMLTPGMPADAIIRWKGNEKWPRWR
ncbi:MAG: efflux RND transporter periplasmic adaptor subunit [Campylobacterota bacterium]|nr:efflux RND transporter periplasmic adaptor subunit [Campylobacterota bacterium]